MKKQRGFTLIELMVVIAVAGIMLAFGVPQITRMLQGNRVVASLNSLSAHLSYARSEAIKRAANISVAGLDPKNPQQWELGWIVFVDTNNDGAFADNVEEQLRMVEALNIPNFTIRPNAGQNSVTYDRFGVAPQNEFAFTESTDSTNIIEKTISISVTGHVSIP